jgi:phosphoglycolate phosphatase
VNETTNRPIKQKINPKVIQLTKGHIVYDCDGTLVSTMEGIFCLMQDFFEKHLKRKIDREEVIRKMDYNSLKTLENFGIDSVSVHQDFLDHWAVFNASREKKYHMFPGILECLKHFNEAGYTQYVWTGRERASTEAIIKALDIGHFFKEISCRDDCEPKPSVAGLEEMLYHADPSDIVVIGDTYADMLGAKDFQAHAVGCIWCENAREDILIEYGADVVLKEPIEMIEYIDKYFINKINNTKK